MILCSHTIGEHEFWFRRPPTTADVYDWFVWAKCRPTLTLQVDAGLRWACQFLVSELDSSELGELLKTLAEDPLEAVAQLCDAIAASAGVPPDAFAEALKLADRQKGLPDDYKPEPHCKCDYCRAVWRGLEHPDEFRKPGQKCVYEGIDARARLLLQYAGEEDMAAPYYVTQMRQVLSMSSARKYQNDRERKDSNDAVRAKSAEIYGHG